MKKSVFTLLMALSSIAYAGAASQSATTEVSLRVPYTTDSRVLHFDSSSNSITLDGRILVCFEDYKIQTAVGMCKDQRGQNAWRLAQDALPGYVLKEYEYRFTGNGSRYLILYFGVK